MSITKQGLRKSLVSIISSFLLFFLSYHCVKHTQHHAAYSVSLDVEPWSFDQCVGEAVIVPAGCPYQNRKNKVYFLITHSTRSHLVYNRKLLL